MRIEPGQLERHLKQGIAPAYLVAGVEPLAIEESCDAIRRRARELGYEREAFTVESGFNWSDLTIASRSLSLFSARRLLELRMPGGKPGEAGARILAELAGSPAPDTVLLVVAGRLERAVQESAWAKAIERSGATIYAREVPGPQFPAWIAARLHARGLTAGPEVIQRLAYHMEGNLLACAQEIEKLALRTREGQVNAADLEQSLSDNARFDVYGVTDRALAGDAAGALRRLHALEAEDGEPVLVLWALARELRALAPAAQAFASGRPEDEALAGVWASRRALVAGALRRLGPEAFLSLLQQASTVDRVIKGRAPGKPWLALERLILGICGIGPGLVPARRKAAVAGVK